MAGGVRVTVKVSVFLGSKLAGRVPELRVGLDYREA